MNAMIENRVANIIHFNVMISRACGDSTQREDVMDQMIELGVSPDVLTYNALLTQLILEGKITRARTVMEHVMPSVHVIPDDRTQYIMTREIENRLKSNSRELEILLRRNYIEKAWLRLNEMNESGSANVIHFTIMMKACSSSTEMLTLMDRMRRLQHLPNTFSYNTLVTQLMLEGRMDDAIDVIEIEMVDYGVKPDEKTMKTIWNHSDQWSMMRTGKRWN